MYLVPQAGGGYRPSPGALQTSARRSALAYAAIQPRRRRRYSALGQLAATAADPTAAIIAQICPAGAAAQPCGCKVKTSQVQQLFERSVASRYLLWPPPDPSWIAGGTQKAAAITGAVAKTTGAAASAFSTTAAAAVLGPAALIAAPIAFIIGIFSAHHAKAQAAQANAIAAGVTSANAALQSLDQALAAGQMTPAQAPPALQQLQQQFTATMKAGTSYKQCDALFAYDLAMKMVVAARLQDLQAASTGAAAASAGPGGASIATGAVGGIPAWAIAAGIAALLLF